MPVGFRIGPGRPPVDAALVSRFRVIATANISDCMQRLSAGGARLRPMGRSRALCGPVLAVRTAPGDNLMVHKAIAIARAGEVIVVDAGGELTNAIVGERMVAYAHERGVAGMVINGAVRDVESLLSHPMPVFAAGVTHRGPYHRGPGEINFPIALDGMVIESGDVIVGDSDGLACVPFRDAEAVCLAAEKKQERERTTAPKGIADIDRILREAGCEFAAT